MQPLRSPHRLSQLNLIPQPPVPPIHRRQMPLPPRQQQPLPIPRIITHIRPQFHQLELEPLPHRLQGHALLHLILPHLIRPLELTLVLQKPGFMLEQDLRIVRFQDRVFVFGFERFEVGAELFVLDGFGGDFAAAPVGLVGGYFSFFEGCGFGVVGFFGGCGGFAVR